MENFIIKPSIDMIPGIKVTKDTELKFETDKVKQEVKSLTFYSETKMEGSNYTSTVNTVIQLEAGDVLLFEDEGRGWIRPVADYLTVKEAINELKCIRDL